MIKKVNNQLIMKALNIINLMLKNRGPLKAQSRRENRERYCCYRSYSFWEFLHMV